MAQHSIGGIYLIVNKINGCQYVGSTLNFQNRHYTHWNQARRNCHQNPVLQNDWNKCGQEAFVFVVLEIVEDFKNLLSIEQKYLDVLFDNQLECYNIRSIADSNLGTKRSLESRKRMSEAHKNQAPYWLGKHLPQETKDKISKTLAGRLFTQERKNNLPNRTGIKLSESHRLAIVVSQAKRKKPVVQMDMNGCVLREFESVKDAALSINKNHAGIVFACQGKYQQAYGYKWAYKEAK